MGGRADNIGTVLVECVLGVVVAGLIPQRVHQISGSGGSGDRRVVLSARARIHRLRRVPFFEKLQLAHEFPLSVSIPARFVSNISSIK
ncbi:hypothetical protein SDC9_95056 [bioreactor metagenome]|uniref:Uncharacterized protein n=1 Tax=bioreactor metagenome TaxID=1076179 RepID=A0A645A5I0_9ZZZZ